MMILTVIAMLYLPASLVAVCSYQWSYMGDLRFKKRETWLMLDQNIGHLQLQSCTVLWRHSSVCLCASILDVPCLYYSLDGFNHSPMVDVEIFAQA